MRKRDLLMPFLLFAFMLYGGITAAQDKHGGRSATNANQANTSQSLPVDTGMMVRIAEVVIFPGQLEEYKSILEKEASASVKIEPGVLAIFPMYLKDDPYQIRIVEIYANRAAYQSHLKTPHFLHYKTTTEKMVRSLKLVDMNAIDPAGMKLIFRKMGE